MSETHLPGLEGTNPLAFLAAVGVQMAFKSETASPRLWWSDDITPHAVVDGNFTVDRITDQVLTIFRQWYDSPAINPKRPDGSLMPKGDELKFTPPDMRTYLRQACECDSGGSLATALIAEGSTDKKGAAKPSDLYFTAGNQKFLETARLVLGESTREDVLAALDGPWNYASELPSLGWDVGDDRVYALRAYSPGPEKKRTNPGSEALAILGLSLHPVFAGRDRTLTQGCSGSWKMGQYSWPLWCRPASPNAVKSLLAHAYHDPATRDRRRWFCSWGVFKVLQSQILRSGQGGYGTFAPPSLI